MTMLLAVEGTGARTQALLTDESGTHLARGFGDGSNLHVVGFEAATRAIVAAIEGALVNALGPRVLAGDTTPWRAAGIAAACFGLGGVDGADDEAQFSRWLTDLGLAQRFVIVNDADLVIAGGTPDGWGVALISGVGSVCVARSREGKVVRVGGWGPLLGDEGSGYQIALGALRLATQTADGRGEARPLLEAILRHWRLPQPMALIRHVHAASMGAAEIASLGRLVVDLAASGDPHARRLVDDAAAQLARQVETAVARLALSRPPLALGGTLLRGGELKRAVVAATSVELGPVAYVADPCRGGITLAQRLLRRAGPASS